MKTLLPFLFLVFITASCNPSSDNTSIDDTSSDVIMQDSVVQEESLGKMLMTNSGNIEPSLDVKLYGCDFTVVLNNSGDTTHWSTNDNNFTTPEGFKVGTKWTDLSPELQNSVNKMLGWGYYINLRSGWQLGFCEGESCTDSEPKEGSIVKWIFKRYY